MCAKVLGHNTPFFSVLNHLGSPKLCLLTLGHSWNLRQLAREPQGFCLYFPDSVLTGSELQTSWDVRAGSLNSGPGSVHKGPHPTEKGWMGGQGGDAGTMPPILSGDSSRQS